MEIERKFLVKPDWTPNSVGDPIHIRQGYVPTKDPKAFCVRVRLKRYGGETYSQGAQLSVLAVGASRPFTYPMTVDEAETLYALCPHKLEKTRYKVLVGNHVWDVDVFSSGLVTAEIELFSEDEEFKRPDWLGEEVTGKPEYLDSERARSRFQYCPPGVYT